MAIRLLEVNNQNEINQVFSALKVDPYGIKIMLPKAVNYLVEIDSVGCIAANILKQEMLSLGADVALPRTALTSKCRKTGCVLIGNASQLNRLNEKLKLQPFGLAKLADELSRVLNNFSRNEFYLNLGRYKLNFAKRTQIMGIINLTPDSFSGDGLYKNSGVRCLVLGEKKQVRGVGCQEPGVIDVVQKMVRDGADIIDIGGESSRPQAKPVTLKEEIKRTIPVIKKIARKIKIPLSIDTYQPEVAKQALDNGAVMVNDISGLRNPRMAKIVARYKAGVVVMHMQGTPATMQQNPHYQSLMREIIMFLGAAIERAISAGIDREKIIIDPGIGFGKTLEDNLRILNKLKELKVLGRPILVGTSRKSFIGKILARQQKERIFGTIASCVLAAQNGANILRVHDVFEVAQALKVRDAIAS